MPEFEFVFWNDSNIAKYDCLYLRQTIMKKAYAFAADYLRLRIVNEFGGFYLDTDMKLIRSLSSLEVSNFMICEQEENIPNWAIFYSQSNSDILLNCLSKYENLYFDQFKPPVIPYFLKDIILNCNDVKLYDSEYFYPLPYDENIANYLNFIADNTYGIHLWDFSWGKLNMERTKWREVLFRVRRLLFDIFLFTYPLYYFKINLIRVIRIIRS